MRRVELSEEIEVMITGLAFHATNADEPRLHRAAAKVLDWLELPGEEVEDDVEPLPPDEDRKLLWDTVMALHEGFTEYKRDADSSHKKLRAQVAAISYVLENEQRRGLRARLRGLFK